MKRISNHPARLIALLLLLLTPAMLAGQAAPPDTLEPVVWIDSPDEDATLSGTVTVNVEAFDASGIGGVVFEVDGVAVGAEDVASPWSFAWNADASGPGSHILTVVARDNAGNAGRSDVVPVVVGGSVTPPPVNHNPIAGGDSLTSAGRVAVNFSATSLLANDSDPDGDPLVVNSVASSTTGGGSVASLGGGSYRYTPGATFTGTDTFSYSIADGRGGSATGAVSVTVTAPVPPPPPPTGGMVLALGFEEASGTSVVDSSASPINGTLGAGAAAPTRVAAGKFGRALSFDGADSLSVPDGAATKLDLTSGMTVEAWVNPSSMNGWESVVYKERGGAGTGLLSYALYAHDGGTNTPPAGYVRTSSGGPDRVARGIARLPLNTWSHVAVTYTTQATAPAGSTLRVYVNGTLVRTVTGANQNILAGSQPLRIGNSNASVSEGFNGLIDEVRIYNRALSAAEIAGDMAAPIVP
jgi:Concanavalin A-like lectin/glucanases superfamily/Bacterial Ig domain